MSRYIKLSISTPVVYVDGRTQGYRVVFEIVEATDVEKELFMYQRKPGYGDAPYTDFFSHIASPADLEEYPIGSPDSTKEPFYRLSVADVIFRSLSLAEDAIRIMKAELTLLVESLVFIDTVVETEVVEIGTPPTSSSSSSA